jgi:hypothetical protein
MKGVLDSWKEFEIDCEDQMRIELAQDRVQWRALIVAVLHIRVLLR